MFSRIIQAAAAAGAYFAASIATAQPAYVPIAIEGQPAPGTGPGVVFSGDFQVPRFGAGGQISFYSMLSGPGIDSANDYGIFIINDQGTHLAVRKNDPAPGVDGATLFAPYNFMFGPDGQYLFMSSLVGPAITSDNNAAFWVRSPQGTTLVARTGSPAPGTENGVTYRYFQDPSFSRSGRVAFDAGLTGPGVDDRNLQAIYAGSPSDPQLVARAGSPAPGADGRTFDTLRPPKLGANGHLAFASLYGDTWPRALFYGAPGELRMAIAPDAPAPGTPAGVTFRYLECTHINALGQVLLVMDSGLAGPGVGNHNDDGIWAGTPDNLKLVARSGDPAPGTVGKRFNGRYDQELDDEQPMFMNVSMSEAGHVAFIARLTDDQGEFLDEWGIWAGLPGDLKLITLNGSFPRINAAGQVLYTTGRESPFGETEPVLMAADLHGNHVPLLWPGQQFDLGDGQLRTLQYWNQFEYYGMAFNDAGEILIHATFTDQTDALIKVAIPEPAALTVALGALLLLPRRRRPVHG